MILEEQFPVPRNTAASKIGNGVILLPWQLRCHCNPDHNKVSSLSNTTVVLIFPNLCLWRRSLRSNVGGMHSKKLYRATLKHKTVSLAVNQPFKHWASQLINQTVSPADNQPIKQVASQLHHHDNDHNHHNYKSKL